MKLMEEIKQKNYETVSIIGLAKNTGKTVTLNYLISQADQYELKIGITSTGRDGESIDLVTNTQKPKVLVTEGMYVATAKKTLQLSQAKVEILETTGMNTPMGEVVIAKVRQNGNIQIAGPVNMHDAKVVCQRLKYFGAEVVFIDGAIDRRAVSSPLVTDACIMATGAVISRDMKKTIDNTAYVVECYTFDRAEDEIRQHIILCNQTCVIQNTGQVILLDILTGITGGRKISEQINEHTTHVFIKGAVTSGTLKDICESKYIRQVKIVIEDGTKIFVALDIWSGLKRKGIRIQVLKNIAVIGLTLNPVSPAGYFFDSAEFMHKMKHYIKNMKIIDVVSGGEEN